MAKIKIKMEKLSKIYNKGKQNEKVVLKNIDLQINDGELVGIIGKSGAGKSTLLNIMACIERFTYGSYKLMGSEIGGRNEHDLCRIRNERIGLVMQDFALVEELTAIENVMIPLDFSKNGDSGSEKQALKALEGVGIADLAMKRCNMLSGGQKQRVAIARAIAAHPGLILADEPTGALDTKASCEIMELFKALNRQGKTVIIVTHDKKVAEMCNRAIEISDGKIAEKI